MKMNNKDIQTLRWKNDCLQMIDQRILPDKFEYISYSSAESVAIGIKSMVVRGAPAIGCAAAYGIALEAKKLANENKNDFKVKINNAFKKLAQSRPTAVNLFWALEKMKICYDNNINKSLIQISEALLNEAHKILSDDIITNKKMGSNGSVLLKDNDIVLTHCNAGALATAGHGTALGVVRSACQSGKKIKVIANETRPFLQGARLTTWELMNDQIPVTLITDNMSGFMFAKNKINCVIVGADRVAINGDVANKIGTYMIAVLAKEHNVPFYVACPLSTIDIECDEGHKIPIEQRDSKEVRGFSNFQWATKNVNVENPAFDITPANFITALITEKGIIYKPNKSKILKFFKN